MKRSVSPVGIVLCAVICGLLWWLGTLQGAPLLYALIELLLFALEVYIAGAALFDGAFCCASAAAAALFSLYDRLWCGGGRSLFAPAAAVIAALAVIKYLKDRTTPAAVSKSDFSGVLPESAVVLRDGAEKTVPAEDIKEGDIVSIRPGETVPCDGEIIAGRSEIDEKPITGELYAMLRSEGERVKAGSRNISGFLTVRADGVSELFKMVSYCCERPKSKKSPTDRRAFVLRCLIGTAAPIAVSAVVFAVSGVDNAAFALALTLLAGSPCAFGASRAFSRLFAAKKAASEGVRFRDPSAIDTLRGVTRAVIDYNGTATVGRLSVCGVTPLGETGPQDIIRLASALCDGADGGDFAAITERCLRNGVAVPPCISCERLAGRITGTVDGRRIVLSSLKEDCEPLAEGRPELEGKLLKAVFAGGKAIGLIAFEDSVKPNAAAAVKKLSERGVDTLLISGGSVFEPDRAAAEVGAERLICGLGPIAKCEALREEKSAGYKIAVADGVSDCAVLSTADCSFALASGAEEAKRCASALLLRNDLRDILPLIGLSESAARAEKLGFATSEAVRALGFAASGAAALFGAYFAVSAICAAGILLAPAAAAIFASRVSFGAERE